MRVFIVGQKIRGWDQLVASKHKVTLISDGSATADAQSFTDADVVFFDVETMASVSSLAEFCFVLHRRGVLTVAVSSSALSSSAKMQVPHFALHKGQPSTLFDNVASKSLGAINDIDLTELARVHERRRRPQVSLIYAEKQVLAEDLVSLHQAGHFVEVVKLTSGASPRSWAKSIAAARGEVIVIVAAKGDRTAADFVQTCIFEHWYPEVEFCFEQFEPCRRSALDLRRFSLRGNQAKADVFAALSSADDIAMVHDTLCASLNDRGAMIATIEKVMSGPNAEGSNRWPKGPKRLNLSWLKERLASRRRTEVARRDRRLRILTYRWHVAHQYELMRLPADFTLVNGFEDHITEFWAYEQRPRPPNVSFRHRSQIDPRDYDLALVHFDENVLCPELSNGVLPAVWGMPFTWLLSLGSIPKIAICHGTPAFKGQYALDPDRKATFEIHDQERLKLVSALANAGAFVVCNSFQAQREWSFQNSRVIWHGFDPNEFRKGALTRGVLTSPEDLLRPHYRGRFEQQEVLQALSPEIEVCQHLRQVPLEVRATNAYASRQFRFYVNQISAFKFYLNTTLRSPMPRSRGEAMMAGAIPVSVANHDVEMFTDNGRDGFFSKQTKDLAAFINDISRDPHAIDAISNAARAKAIDTFHIERFKGDWKALLKDVVG